MSAEIPESGPPAPAVPSSSPAPAPATAAATATTPIDDGWHALPPAAARVAAVVAALVAVPPAFGLTLLAVGVFEPPQPGGFVILAALVLLGAAAASAYARARTRRTRWRLDRRGLQVSRGLAWQGEILVPRSRVQHLDIERGPIERRFGLATLVVHTAGTRLNALRQSGLADADAVALRDALLPEADSGDGDL